MNSRNMVVVMSTFSNSRLDYASFNNGNKSSCISFISNGKCNHYYQGRRSSDDKDEGERSITPSICLLQDELEGEDYMFRTDVDELNC